MENPAYLLGIPLLLLGLLGLTVAAAMFAVPADGPVAPRRGVAVAHSGHPAPAEYVVIGIILAAVTTVEVALFYVEGLSHNFLIVVLMTLSAVKFALVVGYFMHLKYDQKVLAVLFFGGFALAIALFIVVMATLGANLV